ncbi:MAG TPA: serine protease [bacterium]|nr:serine protease [bacterium]
MPRIGRYGVVALALACLFAGSRAGGQPAAHPDDATFMLLAVTADGRQPALGTAFFVDGDGTALTNSHVVYTVRQNPERYRLLAVIGREFYSAAIVCANALRYDPQKDKPVLGRDVAEVKLRPSRFPFTTYMLGGIERTAHLTGLPPFPALKLGSDPAPGTAVRVVGYGLVAERIPVMPGVRWAAAGTVDELGAAPDGTRVFRVASTNRPRQGNSGSPVLDADGRVVGMWTWNEGDNLAFGVAIASSALRRPCGAGGEAPGRGLPVATASR